MGKRQERLAELIKETMGVVFHQEGKRLFGNGFITVTTVRMSKDLGYAFIYLSALQESDPEGLIENIRGHKAPLRKALGDQIKNQVRRIPDLHFYYDDTMDQVERVDQLLKNVDKGNDSDTSGNSKNSSN